MRKLYLIVNNLVLNNIDYMDNEDVDVKRSKRPLSIEGEKAARKIADIDVLSNVTSIYSSGYASALATSKYLSDKLNVVISINNNLVERKIGNTNRQTNFVYFKENQEHDFNYKFPNGESFNNVKERVKKAIDGILKVNQDDEIAIFTHTLASTTYLANYCDIAYNLDNNLILNFNDNPIGQIGDYGVYVITMDDYNKVCDINMLEM